MRPIDWEHSTFDEVLLVIQGMVDRQRLERLNTYKIVEGFQGTNQMPHICDFYSLPYDEEIREAEKKQQVSDLDLYNQNVAQLDNVIWPVVATKN